MTVTLDRSPRSAHESAAAEFDPARFRQVLGHFASGVVIVTATTPDGPVGLTCQSFSAVSLDPPLVLFCVQRESRSWAKIRSADGFCVNILHRGQEQLCERFASPNIDRFDGVDWRASGIGAPVLPEALGWVECQVEDVHPGGDHDIALGRVMSLGLAGVGDPLLFYRGGYGRFVSPCAARRT